MSMDARNDRFIENAAKRIKKLEEKIKNGDYGESPKPPKIILNVVAKRLK